MCSVVFKRALYAAASWVSLIVPSSAHLISFLDNDEVAAVSLSYHFNGCRHARKAGTDDQYIGSIRVPAILSGWVGIWVCHNDLRMARNLGYSSNAVELRFKL